VSRGDGASPQRLGVAPVREEALYFTVVALTLLLCTICLLMLVFTGRRPAMA